MNLRWLLFDYADPALQLSFRKRMKIQWRRVPFKEMPRSMVRKRLLCAAVAALPMIAALILKQYLIIQLIVNNQMSMWLFSAMSAGFILMSWIWISIVSGLFLRPECYYRMRLEGYDVCLGCGYWLRGLDESIKKCPECGSQRELIADKCESKY